MRRMKLPGLKIADKVRKLSDKTGAPGSEDADRLRGRAALAISVLAAFLALASAGADRSAQGIVNANIKASDLWNFYQAKNTRQAIHVASADALETELQIHGAAVPPDVAAAIAASAAKRRATAARYEDEPNPEHPDDPLFGDGKKQLSAQAKRWESAVGRAQRQGRSFGQAAIILQIAIVLGSVSILAGSRAMLWGALLSGAAGAFLLADAHLLLL